VTPDAPELPMVIVGELVSGVRWECAAQEFKEN
jgi:hypothetical protein